MASSLVDFQMDYIMEVWQELQCTRTRMTALQVKGELDWIQDSLHILERDMDTMLLDVSTASADACLKKYEQLRALVNKE